MSTPPQSDIQKFEKFFQEFGYCVKRSGSSIEHLFYEIGETGICVVFSKDGTFQDIEPVS